MVGCGVVDGCEEQAGDVHIVVGEISWRSRLFDVERVTCTPYRTIFRTLLISSLKIASKSIMLF
jgi:hypothetical protein